MAVSTDRCSRRPARTLTFTMFVLSLGCLGFVPSLACSPSEDAPAEQQPAPPDDPGTPTTTAKAPATSPSSARAETPDQPAMAMIAARSVAGPDQMLTLVSEDTAWVWASLGAPAAGESAKTRGAVTLEDFSDFYDTFANALEAELDPDDPLHRVTRSVLDELRGHYDTEGMRALGIAEEPRLVVHALGLAPVLRVELADASATNAALDRVERRADLPARRETFEDLPYRQWSSGSWTLIVALAPDMLTAAVLPSATLDASLPELLGTRPPQTSLASSGALDEIVARHQGGGRATGAGFVSLPRLRGTLGLESAELIAAVARVLEVPGSMADGCVTDLQRLTGLVARVAFVAGDQDDAQWGSLYIEPASTAPLERLRSLRADDLPGLGRHPWAHDQMPADLVLHGGASLPGAWLGIGLDMPGLGAWLKELVAEVRAQPFACTSLVNLNERIGQLRSWWIQLPGGIRKARGLFALATHVDLAPRRGLEAIEGVLVLGSPAPRRLWDEMVAGTRWESRLSTHRVKNLDDSPQLSSFSAVTVRALDDALVLTSGEGVDLQVEALIGETTDDDEPAAEDDDDTLIAELGYDYGRLMSVYFKASSPDAEKLAASSTREAVMRFGLLRLELHLLEDALRLDYRLELRPQAPAAVKPAPETAP